MRQLLARPLSRSTLLTAGTDLSDSQEPRFSKQRKASVVVASVSGTDPWKNSNVRFIIIYLQCHLGRYFVAAGTVFHFSRCACTDSVKCMCVCVQCRRK